MSRHPAPGGVFVVFEKIPRELLVPRSEKAEEPYLRFFADDLENVHPVVVGEIS